MNHLHYMRLPPDLLHIRLTDAVLMENGIVIGTDTVNPVRLHSCKTNRM